MSLLFVEDQCVFPPFMVATDQLRRRISPSMLEHLSDRQIGQDPHGQDHPQHDLMGQLTSPQVDTFRRQQHVPNHGGRDNLLQSRQPTQNPDRYVGRKYATDILAVAWSPDGRRVAAGAADGSVAIWDITRGLETYRSKKARELSSDGEHSQAIPIFEELVHEFPMSPSYRIELAACLALAERKQEAAEMFRGLMEQAPKALEQRREYSQKLSRVLSSLHRLLQRAGLDGEAIRVLEQLAGDFPDVAENRTLLASAYFVRAEAAFRRKDEEQATADLDRAIEANPEYTEAYIRRFRHCADRQSFKKRPRHGPGFSWL